MNIRKFALISVGIIALMSKNGYAVSQPKLSAIQSDDTNNLSLSGDFGRNCSMCEILVKYPSGLLYAYNKLSWSSTKIRFKLDDLNLGENVLIRVKTQNGNSNSLSYKLKPVILPRVTGKPVSSFKLDDKYFYERKHYLNVGEKGEDSFNLSTSEPSCRKRAVVFDHASIVYRENRFGEARIVRAPKKGCFRCPPLKVRWYNEPTGRVIYQLHIYRRELSGICTNRVRK